MSHEACNHGISVNCVSVFKPFRFGFVLKQVFLMYYIYTICILYIKKIHEFVLTFSFYKLGLVNKCPKHSLSILNYKIVH